MIEEILSLQGLFYTTFIFLGVIYGIKKGSEILKAHQIQKQKIQPFKQGQINIPYNSAYEACTQMAKAVQMQIDEIAPKVKDQEHDVALQSLISQRNNFQSAANTISSNQLLMMLDQQFFPYAKAMIPKIMNTLNKWVGQLA